MTVYFFDKVQVTKNNACIEFIFLLLNILSVAMPFGHFGNVCDPIIRVHIIIECGTISESVEQFKLKFE